MNIRRVKRSYLIIKKQKREWKEESKQIDDPKGYICNPKKPKELNKLMEEIFGNDHMLDYVK